MVRRAGAAAVVPRWRNIAAHRLQRLPTPAHAHRDPEGGAKAVAAMDSEANWTTWQQAQTLVAAAVREQLGLRNRGSRSGGVDTHAVAADDGPSWCRGCISSAVVDVTGWLGGWQLPVGMGQRGGVREGCRYGLCRDHRCRDVLARMLTPFVVLDKLTTNGVGKRFSAEPVRSGHHEQVHKWHFDD